MNSEKYFQVEAYFTKRQKSDGGEYYAIEIMIPECERPTLHFLSESEVALLKMYAKAQNKAQNK